MENGIFCKYGSVVNYSHLIILQSNNFPCQYILMSHLDLVSGPLPRCPLWPFSDCAPSHRVKNPRGQRDRTHRADDPPAHSLGAGTPKSPVQTAQDRPLPWICLSHGGSYHRQGQQRNDCPLWVWTELGGAAFHSPNE